MADRRLTFAASALSEDAARIVACVKALERYDTPGIRAGAVQRVMDAALKLTAAMEGLEAWSKKHPTEALPRARVNWEIARKASRDMLDALMELRVRG